jgi:phenylpropionate dioxygenase-like ring-hydroxylating dioxygenase large terminal subunit
MGDPTMNDISRGPPNKVPFRVTNPEQIPVQRYYDEAFFKLETERVWPHVWQMACRLEQIENVGEWVEYKILTKSVIVVRTKSGVKAFHNVCRHRGVKLASGHGECETAGFNCPFHGWRWNIDGESTFILQPEIFSPESLDKAEVNLKPCRVEEWGGSAFINFDNDAPSLRESLGAVGDRLEARNLQHAKIEWWFTTVLPTNWKLAMEAFMEGYHTLRTHPQLLTAFMHDLPAHARADATMPERVKTSRDFTDRMVKYMRTLSEGMNGEIHASEVDIAETLVDMEFPEDRSTWDAFFQTRLKDEIYRQGRAKGVPTPDMNAVDARYPFSPVEFMFPHYFILPTYSAFSSYRIRPLTPETCIFELFSLTLRPEGEVSERVLEPTFLKYDNKDYPAVPMQDYSNLPLQQEGLHSGGFEYMRLSRDAEGLISNYHRLIDGYLEGLDIQTLGKTAGRVSGSFNVPIADIGL